MFLEAHSQYIGRIQDNLRQGMEAGVFRQMDVERTAEAISSTLQGILQGFYIRKVSARAGDSGFVSDERLVDKGEAVIALLLDGLLRRDDGNSES